MVFAKRDQSTRPAIDWRRFLVVVHDVCPRHSTEIQALVTALEPLVGQSLTAAVVPNWNGFPITTGDHFSQRIESQFGEILLHGWTHYREDGTGIVSYLTNDSDEFSGLSRAETSARLELGFNRLCEVFGDRHTGFVPPAWQRGQIDRDMLKLHGLAYSFGYFAIDTVEGERIPVSTSTWDIGRFGRWGIAAELFGRLVKLARGRSFRCLVAHPADVSRGFLPRIVRTVDSWLKSGGTPVLPKDLIAITNVGRVL